MFKALVSMMVEVASVVVVKFGQERMELTI
jgi:hypothetical protein